MTSPSRESLGNTGGQVGGVSAWQWKHELGRADYRKGRPMPRRPADDDDRSEVFARWAGYMIERAMHYMACKRVHDILTDPDDFDPRPPKRLAA